MNRILVTGPSGFIGSELCREFSGCSKYTLYRFFRTAPRSLSSNPTVYQVGDINGQTIFPLNVVKPDVVVHSAALAHNPQGIDDESAYFSVNTEGTLNFAKQCASVGVKRFIFISSIGVHGQNSNYKLDEQSPKRPYNAYTRSKSMAEDGLLDIGNSTNMEIVILRLPLVYGAKAPGNFHSLLSLAATGLPLPFASINNRRSLIYVGNVVHCIKCCLDAPRAANQVFCISDGYDISLRDLIYKIRSNLGGHILLFSCPKFFFRVLGFIFRRKDFVDKLIGDLLVDSSKARDVLDWTPRFTIDEAFTYTVNGYNKKV